MSKFFWELVKRKNLFVNYVNKEQSLNHFRSVSLNDIWYFLNSAFKSKAQIISGIKVVVKLHVMSFHYWINEILFWQTTCFRYATRFYAKKFLFTQMCYWFRIIKAFEKSNLQVMSLHLSIKEVYMRCWPAAKSQTPFGFCVRKISFYANDVFEKLF